MKKFNINNTVKVKLSITGAKVINMKNSEYNKFFEDKGIKDIKKLKEDYEAGDIYENQLWVIMNEFGPGFLVGGQAPFINNEIYFNDKNLKDVEE